MPQFESEIPGPLGDQLPALLSDITEWLHHLSGSCSMSSVSEKWFKGTTMQVQLHHIAGCEGVLGQVREEQFVDHACACHPNRAFLLSRKMRRHDHAIERPLWSRLRSGGSRRGCVPSGLSSRC